VSPPTNEAGFTATKTPFISPKAPVRTVKYYWTEPCEPTLTNRKSASAPLLYANLLAIEAAEN
jgi:hypothetical protein